ncbi:MAG: hypothetical protein ACC707_13005 [Thiohalomonadales bacterium]
MAVVDRLESYVLSAEEVTSLTDWPEVMVKEWLNAIRNVVELANDLETRLLSANNLSDVDDVPTSRDNLGLGTLNDVTFANISSTTLNATDKPTTRTNLGLGPGDTVTFDILNVTNKVATRNNLELGAANNVTFNNITGSLMTATSLTFKGQAVSKGTPGSGGAGLSALSVPD